MLIEIGFTNLKNDVSYMLHARRSEPVVPDLPYLDHEARAFFCEALQAADVYLEYGAGGSTKAAANLVSQIVSVETDVDYAAAVESELRRDSNGSAKLNMIRVNIGLTASWGIPLVKVPTHGRARRWYAYPEAPWVSGLLPMEGPDLILIDGRFRVASAARSLRGLRPQSECLILVDDYEVRPEYWVLESVAEKVRTAGRMAVFRRGSADDDVLERVRQAFALDWR